MLNPNPVHLVVALFCATVSLVSMGEAGFIHAKAWVAQKFIANAWQESREEGTPQKAWAWADTWPVAKLTIEESPLYVLNGTSGEALAFGPGRLSTLDLNQHTVIAGHRDTHFKVLEHLDYGDEFRLETQDLSGVFSVQNVGVYHETDTSMLVPSDTPMVTLITCYPFDDVSPDTEWRWVVTATQI